MDDSGTYQKLAFHSFRNPTVDTLELGRKKHHIPVLLEVDVTEARKRMREQAKTEEKISFTGWVMKCIAQALSEHKHIQAMRQGSHRLILFDDVDISVLVERHVGERDRATDHPEERLPMPCIIRKANEKSVREIHREIRAAQTEKISAGEVQLGTKRNAALTRLFTLMPKFARDLLVWRRLARDPFFAKRTIGTAVVTSVGSGFSGSNRSNGYGWAIPISIHPVAFALGSIVQKSGVVKGEIAICDYLSLTVLFDHDITDGAPVARFIRRLKELLETGYGLGIETKGDINHGDHI